MTDIENLLFLDLETRSTVDLRKTGAYVYASDPSTSVTVARLALGMEEPWEWRPGRELLPKYRAHLEDPTKQVVAHNAQFERLLIEGVLRPRHGWPLVAIDRWICTMARVRAQALPASLDGAGMALGLPIKKDGDGYRLMLQMCRPRAVDAATGSVTWWEDEVRMTRLSDYCSTDVKVERQIFRSTAALPQPELDVWDLTETMNDRGVRFDMSFVAAASIVAEETVALLNHDMNLLTVGAVKTASNIGALKTWLMKRGVDLAPPPDLAREGELLEDLEEVDEEEEKIPDLRRRDIQRLIADPRVGLLEKSVLRCRLEAGKISVRKLYAIHERSSEDGRVKGCSATTGHRPADTSVRASRCRTSPATSFRTGRVIARCWITAPRWWTPSPAHRSMSSRRCCAARSSPPMATRSRRAISPRSRRWAWRGWRGRTIWSRRSARSGKSTRRWVGGSTESTRRRSRRTAKPGSWEKHAWLLGHGY